MTMNSNVSKYFRDAQKAVVHFKSIGVNVTGIAVSYGKELTPDESAALDLIAAEVYKATEIPNLSIEDFNK